MQVKTYQGNWDDFNTLLFGDSENRTFPGDYIDAIRARIKITGTPALEIIQVEETITVDDTNFTITDSTSILNENNYTEYFSASFNGKLIYEPGVLTNDKIIVKTQLNVPTETFTIIRGSAT